MKYLRYNGRPQQNGFTLVETLVAITILLVAIVGPMTIAARGLQSAFFAREQITAFSLAQEGVELIRERRDENALQGVGWLAGIPVTCKQGGRAPSKCGFEVRSDTIVDCNSRRNGLTACRLKYDAVNSLVGHRGLYNHTIGTPTPFFREVFIDEIVPGREAAVTVKVSWQSGLFAIMRTVTLQSRLFNQYDNL